MTVILWLLEIRRCAGNGPAVVGMEVLELVGGGADILFPCFPARLLCVLDGGKSIGLTTSESEEAFAG